MPLTVRKFTAQVRDSTTGDMIPAGLLSSDALGAINTAKNNAISAVENKQAAAEAAVELVKSTIPQDYTALTEKVAADAANMSDDFTTEESYNDGDYITRNDNLYRFTSDHAAGAWTGSDAVQTTVADELAPIRRNVNELIGGVAGAVESGAVSHTSVAAVSNANVTVHIEPGVIGSGAVGPTNPRPLSGFTSVKIVHSRKNLFDNSNYSKVKVSASTPGAPGTSDSGNVIGTAYNAAWVQLPGGVTYAITCPSRSANAFRVIAMSDNPVTGKPYLRSVYAPTNAKSIIFEAPAGTRWIGIVPYNSQSTDVTSIEAAVSDLQIEAASVASDFEAYNGNTLTVSLPEVAGTVYAGKLDMRAGTLTVTHKYVQFDGTEAWDVRDGDYPYFKLDANIGVANASKGWCSHFSWVAMGLGYLTTGINVSHGTADIITLRPGNDLADPSSASGVDDLKTWLAAQNASGTPVQAVFPLFTPEVYQVDPAQYRTFDGTNNVWAVCGPAGGSSSQFGANCGATDLEYAVGAKHLVKYIDDKIAALSQSN